MEGVTGLKCKLNIFVRLYAILLSGKVAKSSLFLSIEQYYCNGTHFISSICLLIHPFSNILEYFPSEVAKMQKRVKGYDC